MTQNMTTGRPLRLILLFSLPLLVGNLFQQFYNMADAFIVGRTISLQALAAVGSTGSIMYLIIGFATGITSGMAIVTAQRFGAGNTAGVRRSFAVSCVISLVLTVALTLVSVVVARPLLQLLRTPADIFDDAYRYTIIIFWGIAAAMLYNLLSNIMRAVGDSRSPLIFLALACVLNIVLDYVLILYTGMGVAGAAVATVAAQLISGLLCLFYIRKKLPVLCFTRQDFAITRAEITAHLRLGLPMGFQSSIIAIGSVAVQFALNGLGTQAVAAFTAAQKIDSFATLPMMSFGITMATFTAQNYGAGHIRRIFKGVKQCAFISCGFAVVMGVVNLLYGRQLAGLFITNNPAAAGQAHVYLAINGACYVLLAILFIFRYALQGLGKSFAPTLAGVMELIMRVFASLVLTGLWGFAGACIAGPLAWLGSCVPLVAAFVATMRHLGQKAKRTHPESPEVFAPAVLDVPDTEETLLRLDWQVAQKAEALHRATA